MVNEEINIPEDLIWTFLIDLKIFIKSHLHDIEYLIIIYRDEKFRIILNEQPQLTSDDKIIEVSASPVSKFYLKSTMFQLDDSYSLRLVRNDWLDSRNLNFLLSYLPFCFLPLKAFHLKRTITLLHFAQTLDGKIAANNGHSKWIGNQENLVHAHRLRALFDGILIGKNTFTIDKPQLTVRHVKGPNPIKIVIGSSLNELNNFSENPGESLFITSHVNQKRIGIEAIFIPKDGNCIDPSTILTELYARNIHSLFIEGGAFTGSSFLSAKSIDLIQLFISPRILGSGITCFTLKEITSIDNLIKFSYQTFKPMGDGVLFSGEVKY
jgi:diaminohydroxyphosphoribosylaminopyrimidine deaminase / 5-amino-6-(5-phosphoribosylamino)uracil reductase